MHRRGVVIIMVEFPRLDEAFHVGKMLNAYRHLGAHPAADGTVEGWQFRTWAPEAERVEVIGEWNGWNGQPLTRDRAGVWSGFFPGPKCGQRYKYRISGGDGQVRDKADPYAVHSELRPGTASVLWDLAQAERQFDDSAWRQCWDKGYDRPLNIYEVHAGSWRRREDGSWLTYRELAGELIPYVKKMKFTAIELLPLAEHPFDGSWGYQQSGYFSVTGRYGTPEEFAQFVSACHEAGIAVIMDIVPVHFVADDHGLRLYDGTPLYELDSDVGYSQWGSCNFNFYRGEVCSFLASAAAIWLEVYHCDGLRMDAVSHALYWQGDVKRGVNPGAVTFLQELNGALQQRFPTCIRIAEDSSDYIKVTAPVAYGGLGFDYKWDMGWMHDTLDYFALPLDRRGPEAGKLRFSMHYFQKELYLLPLSHDEVVHGKKTIIDKLWGTYEEKFQQVRLLYLYMFAHPGKKLNFMGNELAQWAEWSEEGAVEEFLLTYPLHDAFHRFFACLGELYQQEPSLYQGEYDFDRFQWVDPGEQCVFAFTRGGEGEKLLCVMNTGWRALEAYPLYFSAAYQAEVILSTEEPRWGGAHDLPARRGTRKEGARHRLTLEIPGLCGYLIRLSPKKNRKNRENA